MPMPESLQIYKLRKIFESLNPYADEQEIDWESFLDSTLTFPENRRIFSENYSKFEWYKRERQWDDQPFPPPSNFKARKVLKKQPPALKLLKRIKLT